jgi:CheY-like chemotaxis protein
MKSAAPKVLYVDDDSTVVDRTLSHLERRGMHVEMASHPDRALARIRAAQFDCAVSEYALPGRTGLELLEAVREESVSTPFVLFTGDGDEQLAGTAIAAGVDEYVSKAGDGHIDLLVSRVESAVERWRTEARLERDLRRAAEEA